LCATVETIFRTSGKKINQPGHFARPSFYKLIE
jgi:hypothetical protein